MSIDDYMPQQKKVVKGPRLIIGYLGLLTALIGIVVLLPLIYILFDKNEWNYAWCFALPGALLISLGLGLFFPFIYHKPHAKLENHQDAFIVVSCWIIAILGTSLPFWLSGKLNFHQSIFEVTSGWTTTGLSVFNVEEAHINCFLLARTNTMLFGGVGLVLVMISIFSDRYGMRLYSAEGHSDRFLPNLLRSSRTIVLIYIGFISAGIIAYLCFGMTFFDAFNHSITAFATGGFSTKSASIGYFNPTNGFSLVQTCGIQVVSISLMLLGSISFISYIFLFKGKFKVFFSNCENKAELFILALAIPLLVIAVAVSGAVTSGDIAMFSVFHAVSALTTAGFQIGEFTSNTFPAVLLILTILMLFGGQTNSTSGGFKIFRVHIFFKSIWIKIRNTFSPLNCRHADRVDLYETSFFLDTTTIHESNLYLMVNVLVFITGVMIFGFSGAPLGQALFETASMIGTVGLSTGMVTIDSPTYFFYVSSAIMILGRLEIFVIFYSIIYTIRAPFRAVQRRISRR